MPAEFFNPPGLSRGSYSHTAVITGGRIVHVSGQVACDETGKVVGGTFEAQAQRVFENLRVALAAGGAQFADIVKMNVYVRDLTGAKVKAFREIRQRFLGSHQPASTMVGTPALANEEMMLEVEAVAVVG